MERRCLTIILKDMQQTAPAKCQEKIFEEFKELEEQRAKKSSSARIKEGTR